MMRVLVTGGAGFIGSHIVDLLVERGFEVRVLDLDDHREGSGGHLNPGAEYVFGSLLDDDRLQLACKGVDAISHQAATVGLEPSFDDAVPYVEVNDLGTARLLRHLSTIGFGGSFVLAGSMVVYGEGAYECQEHGMVRPAPRTREQLELQRWDPPCPVCGSDLAPLSITEDHPTDPRNVYAATKLHQEHLCNIWGRYTGSKVVVLRYHNVFGPRMPEDTPYCGVAAKFRSAARQGLAPQVFEDGAQLRDFVHVRDVALANLIALDESAPAGTYNVASGQPRSILKMARSIADSFEGPPPEVTGGYRLGDVRHVFASSDLARGRLGFSAETPFEDGIRDLCYE